MISRVLLLTRSAAFAGRSASLIRSGRGVTTPISLSSRPFSASSSIFATKQSIFEPLDSFARRHIGPEPTDVDAMCKTIGVKDMEELVSKTLPASIRIQKKTNLGEGIAEREVLQRLKEIASKNKIMKNYIGLGYTDTITPPVILRNIMENPGWYTQVCYSH